MMFRALLLIFYSFSFEQMVSGNRTKTNKVIRTTIIPTRVSPRTMCLPHFSRHKSSIISCRNCYYPVNKVINLLQGC